MAVSVSTINTLTASVGNPVASGTCFCACVFISTVLLRNTFCIIIAQETVLIAEEVGQDHVNRPEFQLARNGM